MFGRRSTRSASSSVAVTSADGEAASAACSPTHDLVDPGVLADPGRGQQPAAQGRQPVGVGAHARP